MRYCVCVLVAIIFVLLTTLVLADDYIGYRENQRCIPVTTCNTLIGAGCPPGATDCKECQFNVRVAACAGPSDTSNCNYLRDDVGATCGFVQTGTCVGGVCTKMVLSHTQQCEIFICN